MIVSQLEVNFTRLLARCEGMAAEKKFSDWRLDKYLAALDEWLVQLSNIPLNAAAAAAVGSDAAANAAASQQIARPPPDVIAAYKKKVEFLRNLAATENLTKAGAKAVASSQLLGGGQAGPTRASVADPTVGKTSELQLAAKGRLDRDLRDELFGESGGEGGGGGGDDKRDGREGKTAEEQPGKRKADGKADQRTGMTTEDMDQVMQHHKNAQEKIAEEMLSMARSLKETTSAAGRVVRDDTRRIQASSRLADKNLDKLETQSKRLEAHVKKCCDWWVWISLLAVCFTFIMMILFMKLFKKRTF